MNKGKRSAGGTEEVGGSPTTFGSQKGDVRTGLDDVRDLPALVARASARWGERIGLIFNETGERLTYDEILGRSRALAGALRSRGTKPGDRVAVMLRNRPEFPLAWLALAEIGATIVPINVDYKSFDARYVLEHSGVSTVLTSSEFVPLLKDLRPSLPDLRRVASVEPAEGEDATVLRDLADVESSFGPTGGVGLPESLANVQYTSGTTGRPKGCMLSQEYWVTLARKIVDIPSPPLGEDDVMLTAQPFHYMDPQWNVAASLASGAPLVVLDGFHPSTFWEKVRAYGVTFFYCLGLMPTVMLKTEASDLDQKNRVRHVSCSAIPSKLHRELEVRFGAPWHETFGSTETGADTAVASREHDELVGSGCMGRPLPGREVRVVGDDGRPVPRGEAGELVVRGTGMMDGYFGNEGATDAAFAGGWFHTGDLARQDEDGRLFHAGRKKDMIRRSGENVSAAEVEEVIGLHEAVASAAVVAVPDEIRGEEIKAYVVLKEGETKDSVTPEELAGFCSERLARFKVPRYWEYRDELPLTPSEKVAKQVLRDENDDLRARSFDRVDGIWR